MTEADARAALRAFKAVGDIEQWIAEQPWERLAGCAWRRAVQRVAQGCVSLRCKPVLLANLWD